MNRISVCGQYAEDCSFVGVCSQSKMHPWTENILAKVNQTCDHVFSEQIQPYFTACYVCMPQGPIFQAMAPPCDGPEKQACRELPGLPFVYQNGL